MSMQNTAKDYLAETAARDPVPCGSCTACCRGNQAVELREAWGDDVEAFRRIRALNYEHLGSGRFGDTLKRNPDGSCVFLVKRKCSIYEDRPAACRAFDCRRVLAGFGGETKKMVRRGMYGKDIANAAAERMPTLKMTEDERELWATFGGFVKRKADRDDAFLATGKGPLSRPPSK